jgi:hypothetical protein
MAEGEGEVMGDKERGDEVWGLRTKYENIIVENGSGNGSGSRSGG